MRNKLLMKTITAAIAVLMIIFAAGCGSTLLTRPQPLAGVPTHLITGECEISVDGEQITVSGTTDIMDGAQIHVSVVAQNGMVIDHNIFTKNGDEISRTFTISADKYEGVKQITGYITCAPSMYGAQPQNVIDAYGKKFEQIDVETKDNIWNNDGIVVLFASETIDIQ